MAHRHKVTYWTIGPGTVLTACSSYAASRALPGHARRGSPRKCGWTMYNRFIDPVQFNLDQSNQACPQESPHASRASLPGALLADPAFYLLLTRARQQCAPTIAGSSTWNSAQPSIREINCLRQPGTDRDKRIRYVKSKELHRHTKSLKQMRMMYYVGKTVGHSIS
jgi:hypothetical protein